MAELVNGDDRGPLKLVAGVSDILVSFSVSRRA